MILIIDSTEYKQDRSFNKRNLALIKDYGKHGFIDLHIPYIVYMEVLSSIIDDLNQDINQIKNTLLGLENKGLSASDFKTAKSITKTVDKFLSNVEMSSEKLWKDFINESKATLHPFYESDSTLVFDSYFKGGKPFKSLKSRADIPDAFIFQTILRLLNDEEIICITTNDKNLSKSLDDISNVKTYNSLKDFFDSAEFKTVEKSYKSLMAYNSSIEDKKDLLLDYSYVFESAVSEYVSNLQYLVVYETSLPSNDGEVTINAIDDIEVAVNREKIEFINGSFYVPIIVKGIASVDFFVEKHEYWASEHLSGSDWNEWVYLCEDTFPIELETIIVIPKDDFDDDTEPEIEISNFDNIRIITPFDHERFIFKP